jgi:predicted choloylglycine hydrolase
MLVSLQSVNEDKVGIKWQKCFNKSWPYYKNWYLKEDLLARPGYLTCVGQLEKYMPELLPVYEEVVRLAGGGDLAARYLSMYNPPVFISGCTQVAWNTPPFSLIRNYDYNPKWFEGNVFKTNLLKPVIGTSDCNWGLLDGINADGLTVSLTFGGKNSRADGFGIPLIMRYILETCTTTADAVACLLRIPSHMSYNITILDKQGEYRTVYLFPGETPFVDFEKVATNHQQAVEWSAYEELTLTRERKRFLDEMVVIPGISRDQIRNKFLYPPLYNKDIQKNFATLYGVQYDIEELSATYFWPYKSMKQSFENFTEERVFVHINSFNKWEFG